MIVTRFFQSYLFIILLCFTVGTSYTQTLCPKAGISNGWLLSMNDDEVDQITKACAATKAQYFRIDCAWTDVQYEGEEEWNWENVDRVINSATNEGLEIIAIVDYFPPWADVNTDTIFWSEYVYQAGLRYIPQGVHVWEMWNEPNITNFWPGNPNVKDYVEKILKPGSNAIRKAALELNTSVTVLTGGLAPAATDGTNISQLDFFTGIYTEGGKDYFDAAGQHPYCWPLNPSSSSAFNWFLRTEDLRKVMVENDDSEKLIWGTELGWPSTGAANGGVTEMEQAAYLTIAYDLWDDWDWTGPLIWYAYNDAGPDTTYSEDNFGLVDVDFNAKPALEAFLAVTLDCLTPNSISENIDDEMSLQLSPNPSRDFVNVVIDSDFGSLMNVSVYDLTGELQLECKKDFYRLDLSFLEPGLYLIKLWTQKMEITKKIVKM